MTQSDRSYKRTDGSRMVRFIRLLPLQDANSSLTLFAALKEGSGRSVAVGECHSRRLGYASAKSAKPRMVGRRGPSRKCIGRMQRRPTPCDDRDIIVRNR